MRIIRDNIVFLDYNGELETRYVKLLLQDILELKEAIEERDLKGFFISLKDMSFDRYALNDFIYQLNKVGKKLPIPIVLGNYSTKLYRILCKLTVQTSIKLYKNEQIAKLLLRPESFKKTLKVLICNDGDSDNIENISLMLKKYGHSIRYSKDIQDFLKQAGKNDMDFAISQTKLNISKNEVPIEIPHLKLAKTVIVNLPLFVDTAVENLETLTLKKAMKTSHNVQKFDTSLSADIVSAVMNFKGDVSGSFVLIFPKKLAIKSIEAMVGGDVDESSLDEISDGVGEFCNIITGSTKTKFSKKNIKILFDLPKTYTTLQATKNVLSDNFGIWINMLLDKSPFYMYIV